MFGYDREDQEIDPASLRQSEMQEAIICSYSLRRELLWLDPQNHTPYRFSRNATGSFAPNTGSHPTTLARPPQHSPCRNR